MYIQECDRHRVDGEVPLGRYPVKQKLSATFIVTHLVTRKTLVKQKNIHTIWILVKDSWKPRLFISSSRSVSLIIAFGVVPLSLLCTERKNNMTESPSISHIKIYVMPLWKTCERVWKLHFAHCGSPLAAGSEDWPAEQADHYQIGLLMQFQSSYNLTVQIYLNPKRFSTCRILTKNSSASSPQPQYLLLIPSNWL